MPTPSHAFVDSSHGTNVRADRVVTPHLVMLVAGSRIAIRADETLEIWHTDRCHAIPGTPPHVIGLANWRGTPLVLVDLARGLALRPDALPRREIASRRIVVASVGPLLVGLVVEGTGGVFDVDSDACRDPSVVTAGSIADFAIGEFDGPQGITAAVDAGAMLEALRVPA